MLKTQTLPAMPYAKLPSLAGLLVKALVSRKPGLKDTMPLERIERSVSGARVPPDSFAAYKKLCGFPPGADIPLPYYYVMAQRVQLALLTDPAFPLGIAGLVHIENSFIQHLSAGPQDPFDLICRIDGDSIVPAGREFEIATDFFVGGSKAVECRSRFLSRNRSHAAWKKPKAPIAPLSGDKLPIYLPSNTGRMYARVSGDYNPIHLYTWSARPFGFRQPIAQGIYTLSLVSARLDERLSWTGAVLSVEYKLPVFLPAEADLVYSCPEDRASCRFEVRSGPDEKLHLKGSYAQGREGGSAWAAEYAPEAVLHGPSPW